MADQKISELTALTGANVADDDAIAIVDTSATETKKIVFSELKNALDTATGFVRITGDTMTGDLSMGDNVKAIFGAGSDLQIYHDGSNNYVDAAGVGHLYLQSQGDDKDVKIRSDDGSGGLTEYFRADGSLGKAQMFYYGTKTLETNSTGVDVTGTVTADAFQSDSGNTNYNLLARNSSNVAAYIQNGGSGPVLEARSGSMSAGQGDLHLKVANNGDISFYEDTGTTAKFFWDASAESLGIGTSSPTGKLSIASGTYNAATPLATADDIVISGNQSLGMSFITASAGSSNQTIAFGDSDNTDIGMIRYAHANNSMQFTTNTEEAMRIDSSGNLLVGKTSTAVNTQGIQLGNNGRFYATSDGAESAVFNRKTSDGVIASFRKDNTTVGSIGTLTDDLSIGNLDTGLIFQGAGERISPFNPATNTYRDAAIDLGYTTRRFKDLYLSGGVYLGGTGSANKLEDYEEGTWTPSVEASSSNPTVGYDAQRGTYTKVGRLVTIHFYMDTNSRSGGSGDLRVGGIPFAISSDNQALGASQGEYKGITMPSNANNIFIRVNPNATYLNLEFMDTRASVSAALRGNIPIGNVGADSRILATVTYITDS